MNQIPYAITHAHFCIKFNFVLGGRGFSIDLMNMMKNTPKTVQIPKIHNLKSGLKLITMERPSPIKSVGVFIKAGSRYTRDFPLGLTQVAKRTALKGTSSLKSEFELMSYVDSLGGELNCEFQRDLAVYFAKFYSNETTNIISTLSDTIFNPVITNEEFNLQKKLITSDLELREYNTELDGKFLDYIMDSCFKNNTLGIRETPTTESLMQLSKESLFQYFSLYYSPNRMSIAGINIPSDSLLEMSEKFFECRDNYGWQKPTESSISLIDSSKAHYTGGYSYLHEGTPRKQPGHVVLPELAYLSIGFEGVNEQSEDIYPMAVLYSLIGQGKSFSVGGPGKGMYNRVNLNILNQHYWVNSCEAFVQSFEDSGVFVIYGSCDPKQISNFVKVILSEYYKVINSPIEKVEFDRAKRQLLSQLIMNLEMSNMALEDLGRQSIYGDQYKNWPELFERVNQVTVEDVRRVCTTMMKTNPAVAAMGNLSKMPKYEHIQEAVSNMKTLNTRSKWFG